MEKVENIYLITSSNSKKSNGTKFVTMLLHKNYICYQIKKTNRNALKHPQPMTQIQQPTM